MAWEFEDLSVNQPQQDNSPAQRWEFEDVNVPSQTVLDDDSGEVYAVPVSFDERDTRFAIETQTKGADKADFFGKIKAVSADVWNGTQNLGKGIEESIQSAERGIVSHLGQVADTFLHAAYHAPEKAEMLEEVNQGNFARWGENLSDERKQEIAEKVKAANDWLARLRDKNAAFWNKGKDILRPEKEMDNIDRFWEAVGGAGASVGEAVAATMVTKNPTAAAAIISGLYGRIRYTEYFDKALEAGMDVDEADFNATVAGTIEGGIELAGERLLLGVAKIKPIQELGNRVLSSAAVKAAQSTVGKAAIRKIGSRHTNSVFAQALKGFAAEGGEEAAQSYLGMNFENATAVSDYSDDEILRESLFSFVVGGLPGAGTAVVGSSIYNRRSREINRKIKNILETETPELTKQESQQMADAVQEVLYQETGAYAEEMSAVLQKELDPDVNAEGIDVASLTEQTRKILKEHYQMSDEEIDKTLKVSLGFIDARNQFNEAYSLFREGLEAAGRLDVNADAEARILSARAVALARAEKKTVNEVLERWNLRFQQEKAGNLNENVLEQAMYRSKLNSLESFVNDVINNSEDTSARYFANVSPSGINFDIPRDTILHDKKHALTAAEWAEVADNIDNIEGAAISPKKRFDGQAVLMKISTPSGKYGVVFEHMKKGRNIITTAFKETDAKLDGWIKVNSARAMRKAPTTQKGLLSGRSMADIIAVLEKNVNEPLYQGTKTAKGAYQNSIIYLFEKADASTVVHELAHFFLDDMRKFADNETTKAQLEAIYKYVGAEDGNLSIEQHEYFARSFEAYLMDGRSPNQLLSKVFARFKRWLRGIYKTVRSLDVELNDEIRKTFDDMLGGRSLDFAMQVSGAKMLESLDSGNISPNVVNKALQLLGDGKMSRADMDDLIERLKTGELQRKEINQELKRFENSNTTHRERLNPFDKVKYKELLSRGNFNKKDVVDKINRILKWSEPKKVNGKLVGRFPNLQMNKQFEHIRELMALDKNEAKLKIAENVKLINAMIRGEETGNIDKLVFDNKILSVAAGKAEARLLIEVYNALSDSYNAGRLTTAIIVNSNHYIAFSDKLLDINAVLGDVQVKNIIRNLFGEKANRRISYEISRIASNDKVFSMMGLGDLFNKVRSNYAVSVLGLKPALAIKQLTSFPAYWEHMSLVDFMAGMADFARHPKQAMKILSQTTLMKSRDVNIIKDFEELSKSELLKKGGNKIGLRELMMLNIRLGDRGAIYLGGWALYKSELKKNLAAGMDEAKAKAKALEAFERITDETQQSGRLSQQSYWQSNPFLRAFTMFQSSQNQYLRKEINAVRGLLTGRMNKDKAVKTLFIYHVLLPCLFQWAADGFRWDDKAQLKAALLGSLNGVFALNTVLSKLYDVTLGDGNTFTSDVKVKDVVPFWGSVEELKKQFVKFAEEGITAEDYFDVVKAFAKPVGELSGIPVKYPLDVIKNFGDYADDGEYGKEVLLWLGWSPYALRDLD